MYRDFVSATSDICLLLQRDPFRLDPSTPDEKQSVDEDMYALVLILV